MEINTTTAMPFRRGPKSPHLSQSPMSEWNASRWEWADLILDGERDPLWPSPLCGFRFTPRNWMLGLCLDLKLISQKNYHFEYIENSSRDVLFIILHSVSYTSQKISTVKSVLI